MSADVPCAAGAAVIAGCALAVGQRMGVDPGLNVTGLVASEMNPVLLHALGHMLTPLYIAL